MLKYFTEMGLSMHHLDTALRHLVILNPAEAVIAPASIVLCSHDIHENEVLLEARPECLTSMRFCGGEFWIEAF